MQQSPGNPPPPQFSPDGLYWWDGSRWMPRADVPAVAPRPMFPPPPPPPGYSGGGTPSYLKPSPGLRIVLIIALSLEALITGLVSFAFIVSVIQEGGDVFGYVLGFAFVAMFVLSGLALLGVSLRTAWSRWVAIAAGILISWTCIGAVIGIPILVTAARAPDLTPRGA